MEEVSGESLVKQLKRAIRERVKAKVRDFFNLNVICKLVAEALRVDKLPEAMGTEGEEKKGHSVLGNIVKFKEPRQSDMRSRKV